MVKRGKTPLRCFLNKIYNITPSTYKVSIIEKEYVAIMEQGFIKSNFNVHKIGIEV